MGEHVQDALGHRLLDAVTRRGIRRLFIGGLRAFIEASVETDRIGRFFWALCNELQARGVTTLYSAPRHCAD